MRLACGGSATRMHMPDPKRELIEAMKRMPRISILLAGAIVTAAMTSSHAFGMCKPNTWFALETDDQLRQKVDAITSFPSHLDARIWNGMEMKPEVRDRTLAIVDDLVKGLKLGTDVSISSTELFGSNASYEYDAHADFGVHVFLRNENPAKLDAAALENLLRIYNSYIELKQEGKILFSGIVVEITFHTEPRSSSYQPKEGIGQFSITKDRWIVQPIPQPDHFDRKGMASDARHWVNMWNELVCDYASQPVDFDCDRFDELDKAMKDYRSAGFAAGLGSRSTANLTYRMLRRLSVNIPDGVDMIELECRSRAFSIPDTDAAEGN